MCTLQRQNYAAANVELWQRQLPMTQLELNKTDLAFYKPHRHADPRQATRCRHRCESTARARGKKTLFRRQMSMNNSCTTAIFLTHFQIKASDENEHKHKGWLRQSFPPLCKGTDKTDAQKRSNRRRLGREGYGYKGRMEARPCGRMQGGWGWGGEGGGGSGRMFGLIKDRDVFPASGAVTALTLKG